jgi:hypothetical protein
VGSFGVGCRMFGVWMVQINKEPSGLSTFETRAPCHSRLVAWVRAEREGKDVGDKYGRQPGHLQGIVSGRDTSHVG